MPSNAPAAGAGAGAACRLVRRIVLAGLVSLFMLVLPPVAGAGGSLHEPGSDPGAAAQQRGIRWTACGPRLQCARVRVPLDWRRRRGRTIRLAVIRHLASHPELRIGSLFINPGGPGDSGVRAVVERGESLDALTQGRFDVVGWDIRGSGASARVSCFTSRRQRARFWQQLPVPTTRPAERRYLAKTAGFAKRCGALNRRLLAHISTADTVRDLDRLRGLVGDPQLTFLGESAGTLIGQTYANLFPRRVRAMTLDGIVDPVAAMAGTASAVAATLTDTTRCFAGSWPSARRRGRPGARLRATAPWRHASTACSGGCAAPRSPHRPPHRPASSPTASP